MTRSWRRLDHCRASRPSRWSLRRLALILGELECEWRQQEIAMQRIQEPPTTTIRSRFPARTRKVRRTKSAKMLAGTRAAGARTVEVPVSVDARLALISRVAMALEQRPSSTNPTATNEVRDRRGLLRIEARPRAALSRRLPLVNDGRRRAPVTGGQRLLDPPAGKRLLHPDVLGSRPVDGLARQ
jgi:hypothetical protein